MAVGLRRIIIGFSDFGDNSEKSVLYFISPTDALFIFKYAIYVTQTYLVDCFLVSKSCPHTPFLLTQYTYPFLNFTIVVSFVCHL